MVHNFSLFCKKKHTFSILYTHFYKTPTSVYLLYTLFYINNIFFILLSPNPQTLYLSLFPNPQSLCLSLSPNPQTFRLSLSSNPQSLCLSLIPQSLCTSFFSLIVRKLQGREKMMMMMVKKKLKMIET